jgi:hypothetical protein
MSTFALSENATTIFNLRYPIRDAEGKPTETPEEVVQRVVQNVASVNALYADGTGIGVTVSPDIFPAKTARRQYDWLRQHGRQLAPTFAEQMAIGAWAWAEARAEYEEMILKRRFFPNSPTWTGAGTPLGQLAACFVLPIADDLARGRDSIFGTLTVAALIQQTGGGNGFSFGRLRPKVGTFNNPMGANYDRFSPEMAKETWGMTHKWADCVFFGNFESVIVGGQMEGKQPRKGKGIGGRTRVLYTVRHDAYDAKNRLNLPPDIEMGDSPAEGFQNFMDAIKAGRANAQAAQTVQAAPAPTTTTTAKENE